VTTIPLILQIQQAALDSDSSLTDALRKAKIACVKLGLTEFEKWVDLELGGYMDKPTEELPTYRKLYGTPQAYNPFHGWQPIIFQNSENHKIFSFAPIGMMIAAIETSIRGGKSSGWFIFEYSPEMQKAMQDSMNWQGNTHIKLDISQVVTILDAVRNILLNWTLEMEKQGIVGKDLIFTPEEREKSAAVTEKVIHNQIHIGQVGSFVQTANSSVVQGGVNSVLNMSGIRELIRQIEAEKSRMPKAIWREIEPAVDELKKEMISEQRPSALRRGLGVIQRVCESAASDVIAMGIGAMAAKLLAGS
jgi:hypothetical protein